MRHTGSEPAKSSYLRFLRNLHHCFDDVGLVRNALVHGILDVVKVKDVGHNALQIDFAEATASIAWGKCGDNGTRS